MACAVCCTRIRKGHMGLIMWQDEFLSYWGGGLPGPGRVGRHTHKEDKDPRWVISNDMGENAACGRCCEALETKLNAEAAASGAKIMTATECEESVKQFETLSSRDQQLLLESRERACQTQTNPQVTGPTKRELPPQPTSAEGGPTKRARVSSGFQMDSSEHQELDDDVIVLGSTTQSERSATAKLHAVDLTQDDHGPDDGPQQRRQQQQATTAAAPCRFFARGYCSAGAHCRFRHGGSAAPPCRYWNGQHGSCRCGSRCSFNHDIAAVASPAPQSTQKASLAEWQAKNIRTVALPDGVKAGCVIGKKGLNMEAIRHDNPGVDICTDVTNDRGEFRLCDTGGGQEALKSATLTLQAVVYHERQRHRLGWRRATNKLSKLTNGIPVTMLMKRNYAEAAFPLVLHMGFLPDSGDKASSAQEIMAKVLRGDITHPVYIERVRALVLMLETMHDAMMSGVGPDASTNAVLAQMPPPACLAFARDIIAGKVLSSEELCPTQAPAYECADCHKKFKKPGALIDHQRAKRHGEFAPSLPLIGAASSAEACSVPPRRQSLAVSPVPRPHGQRTRPAAFGGHLEVTADSWKLWREQHPLPQRQWDPSLDNDDDDGNVKDGSSDEEDLMLDCGVKRLRCEDCGARISSPDEEHINPHMTFMDSDGKLHASTARCTYWSTYQESCAIAEAEGW
jgi:hypothetical protein